MPKKLALLLALCALFALALAATAMADGHIHEYGYVQYIKNGLEWHRQECTGCEEFIDDEMACYDDSGDWPTCSARLVCAECRKPFGAYGPHEYYSYLSVNDEFHEGTCVYCYRPSELLPHRFKYDYKDIYTHTVKCLDCDFDMTQDHDEGYIYDDVYHTRTCETCNWLGSERMHQFRRAYNSSGHYDACIDCPYATPSVPHDMTVIQSNAGHHWNGCTGCNYIDARISHTFSYVGDDTTTDKQHRLCCTYCKYYGQWESHYSAAGLKHDESGHWEVCGDCEYENTAYKQPHISKWKYDDDAHWQECSDCERATTEKSPHELTWFSDETEHWQECECGYIANRGAHANLEQQTDADGHWTICADCEYIVIAKAAHSGGKAACGKPATCEGCGAEYGLPGKHKFIYTSDGTANCLTETMFDKTCALCGLVIEGEMRASHHYGAWSPADENTHTASCLNCGYSTARPCVYIEYSDGERAIKICGVCGDLYIDGARQAPAERVLGATIAAVDEGAIPPDVDLVVFKFEDGYALALEYFGEIIEPLGSVKISVPVSEFDFIEFTIDECGIYK